MGDQVQATRKAGDALDEFASAYRNYKPVGIPRLDDELRDVHQIVQMAAKDLATKIRMSQKTLEEVSDGLDDWQNDLMD